MWSVRGRCGVTIGAAGCGLVAVAGVPGMDPPARLLSRCGLVAAAPCQMCAVGLWLGCGRRWLVVINGRGSLPGAGVEISTVAAALTVCQRSPWVGWVVDVDWWPLGCRRGDVVAVAGVPGMDPPARLLPRCGLVAVGWLQRCARPTASVARILQHLTRPVLCPLGGRFVALFGRWFVAAGVAGSW